MLAKARELRDRYLERVNESLILPAASGKYDVSRSLEAQVEEKALPFAAAG